MTNAMRVWTDERVALLGRLWAEGESASRIAGELGVSRNAVIGKVHRLGLPGRRTAHRASAKRGAGGDRPDAPKKPDAGRSGGLRLTQGALALKYFVLAASKPRSGAKLRLAFAAKPAEEAEAPAGVTLLALEDHMCRWPEGDPKTPGFHFCGRTKAGELSYCARHARIAYAPGVLVRNSEKSAKKSPFCILNTEKYQERTKKTADRLRKFEY